MNKKIEYGPDFFEEAKSSGGQRILFIAVAVGWSIIIMGLLYWSLEQVNQRIMNSALIQARSSIEQDILYRRWNAQHGGVYGQVSEFLQPNKYLKIMDRDITTPTGLKLTKINPSYMTRQVHELGKRESGVFGHITSLKPIRPENKADEWEAGALKKMEFEAVEVSGIQEIEGTLFLRMMVPLVTEKACLKCHAEHGYKIGDVRGGISGSVPLAPLSANVWNERIGLMSAFGLAWLFGCATIFGVARIKASETTLRVSEEKYRALVETMKEGMVILDNAGRIAFSSEPMAVMLGAKPHDILGEDFKKFLSSENVEVFFNKLNEAEKTELESFELEMVTRNSGHVVALFSPRVLRDNEGKYAGLLAVLTDITGLKELEKELLRQQRLSSLGLLAGGIAHEINTPAQYLNTNTSFLQSVLGDVEKVVAVEMKVLSRLREDSSYSKEVQEVESSLEALDSGALLEDASAALNENMQGIQRITDIVASVKSLAGAGPVFPESVNINTLIQQSLEVTRNSWEPVANLSLELESGLQKIECISRDISQVVTSIIVNCVDAIKEKQTSTGDAGKGSLEIITRRNLDVLEIVITDTGIGMPDSCLEKIFEPFYTTKDPGKGVGQGLAIAYRVAADHNGSIVVHSTVGVGTEVIVTLPVKESS
ncbi:MAG: DUF3365 domain-containing protein [Pseudodesulfovibrio sp.]